MNPVLNVLFIRLTSFERSADGLLSDEDERELEQMLADNPLAGPVISGTGGVRKVRVATRGKGKRGGARVIYYYRPARERIYLVLAYPKSQQDNLSASQKKRMKELTRLLDKE